MNAGKGKSAQLSKLRERAEVVLGPQGEDLPEMSAEEVRKLVHELRTYQIELEMQNEELRTAQEELTESRDRYSDLYDFAPVGYLTLNEKGVILQANLTAAEMLGVERTRLINQRLSGFVVAEDEDIYYLHRRQLLETRKRQTCELRIRKQDDRRFWAKTESTLTEDTDAGGLQIRTILSDITERKRAEEELKKAHAELERRVELRTAELAAANVKLHEEIAEREKTEEQRRKLEAELTHTARLKTMSEMASGLAHELNQPLGAIVLKAEALAFKARRDPARSTKDLVESLAFLAEQANRAGSLVRRMRQFAKHATPKRTTLTLAEVVAEVVPLVEKDLREAGVAFTLDADQSLPEILADKLLLQQVLLNLTRNAIEAMESTEFSARRLDIQAHVRDGLLEVAVRDSGCGIPADNAGHIDDLFRTFYSTKAEGMGMGLWISRSIIESHGGRLWAEPNPDRGATFTFTLPITTQDQENEAATDRLCHR